MSETPTTVHDATDNPDPGDCGHEWHGADGGACPGCGWNSHPVPLEPAPPWVNPLPAMPSLGQSGVAA